LKIHSMGKNNCSANGFLRHGIFGWHTHGNSPVHAPANIGAMRDTFHTQLPINTHIESDFEVATTGSSHQISNGTTIAIAGRPYFRSKDLKELVKQQGIASALASGYAELSQDIFKLLFGSFCCAIIDAQANRVLIAIDRLGQEAMYYRATEGVFYFGSSASSVLASEEGEPTLLNQGIYNYVYFHMLPSPGSIYSRLKKIPAAHYVDYHNGQCQVVNYWQPEFSESTKGLSFGGLSKQLKDTLRTSVENCLSGSGKAGSFLSGGLDSSTVTGLLAEASTREAEAYSIGFSAEGYDEMAYARITARHFDVKLNEYYVTPQDVVDALPMIATSYDEPFGNSSALPAYFCAKMAAENGVSTLLAGDGGDEIFGGNERYIKQRVFEHYAKIPGKLRRGLLEPVINAMPRILPLVTKANSYITQANMPLPDRLQSYNFLNRHAASDIFSDAFLAEVNQSLPLEVLRSIYHRPQHASDLNRMLYLDWQITLADNDLRKVSHMCALAGVDVAYPMLDDALVEFSCQVPSAWKIKGTDLRHFFKRALKGWLPEETINKRKQGFGLPFGVWMQSYKPLRELAYDNLLKLKSRNVIRSEFIDRTIKMHQSEHAAYYGELVWIFTVFELWMDGRYERNSQESARR
jgi:asparagine synthase (glutamine-hydrolysing)